MGPISPCVFFCSFGICLAQRTKYGAHKSLYVSCYLGICLAQRTKYGARKSLCVFLLLWYLFAGPQYVNLYV